MIEKERLSELTGSYLKSLIAGIAGSVDAHFDSATPFGELGVDSFRVLKIIKALEADFGALPKTLLFEHFNIDDLARYFVERHAGTLERVFAKPSQAPAARAVPQAEVPQAQPVSRPAAGGARPILMLEKDAWAHPELGCLVREIFNRYKNEGSVSRGTRNIAPNLFIGSERKGYFNYARGKNLILAYTYTGPRDYFATLAHELHQHCAAQRFELNLLAEDALTAIGGVPFSATPFGGLQRILNLQSFTLEGGAMRRLRYQVSKFEKAGACRTEEYRHGAHPEAPASLGAIIDGWCAARTLVNPLIHIVKEEILAGTLNPEHRIFLTYRDDVLQNVILISPLCAEQRGYLMDLEFYTESMPLGGLEFAIVKIIEVLVAEGCEVLSLGGTYGCKLASSANADLRVDRILDELRMQNIFNDEGNLQFKNKFRPENKAIYLCRPEGECDPDNVVDIIMMIADPMNAQTTDEEHHNPPSQGSPTAAPVIQGAPRSAILAECAFNPLNVPSQHVEIDLKTDSWAQLCMPAIENHARHLHARMQQRADLDESLRAIFPFTHFALTTSGRTAEGVFYKAWARKGVVPQNLLFPTTLFHQIDKGFTPQELPHPTAFLLESNELYKGNLDEEALQKLIAAEAATIPFVCIEVSDNAAGGYPVSLAHLRRVSALLAEKSIPLVMDATRVLENAWFLIENEAECAGRSVWDVAREICGYANAVIVSLAKDFCVKGGLIATRDPELFDTIQRCIREEGCGLDAIQRKLAALTLQDRQYIETQSLRRTEAVKRIWTALAERGVPVVRPAGGHCLLIDVRQVPQLSGFQYPVASFVAWLYLNTGIRAGAHNAGMQHGTPLNNLVRLAIPLGLRGEQVDAICDRVIALFSDGKNIPEIEPVDKAASGKADVHARYRLIQYHQLAGTLVAQASAARPEAAGATPLAPRPQSHTVSPGDVAIVGMAGRYPKANTLHELWENLLRGADCIEYLPESRLEQRLHTGFTKRYRGGFIDDVNRFDASFFNVSAKDAALLDPQERLFLEVAYEAVEDAGYYPEILGGEDSSRDIGVFVGAVWSMYQMVGLEERLAGRDLNPSSFFWSIANRVSYWMNLSGPSLTVDTACSASLTALKLACEAIQAGECSAALVGGVNLDLHQSKFDINSAGGSLSADGVCRSFGKGANGYVSGEGVGALFLKPLEQAIMDGDNIHGVIKSAVVTHTGKTSGYMIPSPHPQTRMIAKALARAAIDARSIGYVEAHGTGTELGDSIEIAALTHAFQKHGAAQQSCAIGSIKPNIGHLEAASGIVGVQKILLQMKHRTLVPSLHSAELNEGIDFARSPFRVQQTVEEWKPREVDGVRVPRRAGISAIGAGGTNAHLILEEYEPAAESQEPAARGSEPTIFPLSARTEDQLRQVARRLCGYLRTAGAGAVNDIAHTLQLGRKAFDHRLVVIAKTREALAEKLTGFIEGRRDADVVCGHVKNAEAITAYLSSRERNDFVSLLAQSGDAHRLARLWSDGVIAQWRGLGIESRGRRISLPPYPFADERYWIGSRKAERLSTAERSAVPHKDASIPEPHPKTQKWAETYQFSFTRDSGPLAGKLSGLSVEAKGRLFVRQMLAAQLRVSVAEVNDGSHLMDTGITSLDMAEMTQSIKDRIDPGFSPIAFFECTTVRSFSELLTQKYAAIFQNMTVTKLAVESGKTRARLPQADEPAMTKPEGAAAPLHVQDAQSPLSQIDFAAIPLADEAAPRGVFLTGSTGFLGIHVLAEFLSSRPDVQVYCLVRAASPDQGLQRIQHQAEKFELVLDESRIAVLCGDITAPRLGLSEDDWALCCRETQQIVHACAHVNHIEGYATFRESTLGMKEIIRLAGTQHLKLVQFISSIAGCALKLGEEFAFFEKEDFVPQGIQVYGGYGQSKWVQETFLKRAYEQGLPYVIHRFGELSGAVRSGLGQTEDMLHRLIQMRLAVGCREKISSDVLDMLPVDFAAKLIVGVGGTPGLWNTIVHATHLKPYSLANLYRKAQSAGLQFKPVTRAQYLSACYEFVRFVYSIHPVNGFVLECVLRDAEGSIRERKMMDGYFSVIFPFAQDNFKRSLQALDLALPEWNALLDRYFKRWSEDDCGFMARIFDYQHWSRLDETEKAALTAKKPVVLKGAAAEKPKGKLSVKKSAADVALLETVNEA